MTCSARGDFSALYDFKYFLKMFLKSDTHISSIVIFINPYFIMYYSMWPFCVANYDSSSSEYIYTSMGFLFMY